MSSSFFWLMFLFIFLNGLVDVFIVLHFMQLWKLVSKLQLVTCVMSAKRLYSKLEIWLILLNAESLKLYSK